jgi:hypothetical protein
MSKRIRCCLTAATSFGLPPWRCAPPCFRAPPFHWQFGQTAGHRTGTHPKLLERDCEPHRGKARQQLGEDRLQFDPGERGAEAVVGAVPEREMGRPFAGDVEAIGAGKDRGIVVFVAADVHYLTGLRPSPTRRAGDWLM